MDGEYTFLIIAISFVIVCLSSYTALSMNDKSQHDRFVNRYVWLGLASVAMGIGIWSMHFIGMSAYVNPNLMKYGELYAVGSAIPVILASYYAFVVATRKKDSKKLFVKAGFIMGTGIATTHVLAALLIESSPTFSDYFMIFIVSTGTAVLSTIGALYLYSQLKKRMKRKKMRKLMTAMIIGSVISTIHYAGLIATNGLVDSSLLLGYQSSPKINLTLIFVSIVVVLSFLGLFKGITVVIERYVEYRLKNFDALTLLPNRKHFERVLATHKHVGSLAVIHIHDLGRWNRQFGYTFGDQIIANIAEIIAKYKPLNAYVSRIEGNRFVLFVNEHYGAKRFINGLESLMDMLKTQIKIDDHSLTVDMVCAVATNNEAHAEDLFANTLAVLDHSSIRYSHDVVLYQPSVHTYSFQNQIVDEINQAMTNRELFLVYQPKVCSHTREVLGLEALLRWQHPTKGFISPGVFIPVLEENGKMFDVTDWVIEEVCRQLAAWSEGGKCKLQVAINIPGPYVTSPRLMSVLKNCISKYGINPNQLELEITETSVINNIHRAIKAVNEFRLFGFSVALDDFGTGVSSLSYLKRLPISTLKIDKSFVDDIPDSEKDSAILKTIISLGQSLHLNVVIEGVESEKQMEFLRSLSECPVVQGYYFSKPLENNELVKWLDDFSTVVH